MTQGENRPIGRPFPKGQSGNPGGRPREVGDLRSLAREHTQEALDTLTAIMQDDNVSPATRVSAACAILDRGYGKPMQHSVVEGGMHETTLEQLAALDALNNSGQHH